MSLAEEVYVFLIKAEMVKSEQEDHKPPNIVPPQVNNSGKFSITRALKSNRF
ncbi:MAG: hypothetical protein Roseis2KO_11810 [Roseivirga sp.]